MNIFVTDPCPVVSASNLDDKRVNKMILESAQMLCTALHLNGASHLAKYKKTHINHPSNIWARTTRDNYLWLLEHFNTLCIIYTHKTRKIHACQALYSDLAAGATYIPAGSLTPFANCAARSDMGISFKHIQNVPLAYKLYLIKRWEQDAKFPQWSMGTPSWLISRAGLRFTFSKLLSIPL